MEHCGHNKCKPPSCGGRYVEGHDESINEGHDQLGDAGSHVGPAGREAVGEADDAAGEHAAHPELVGDEVGERKASEEAEGNEGVRGGDEGGGEDDGGGDEGEGGDGDARAHKVADGAHGNAGEDGAEEGGRAGSAGVRVRKIEVVLDDGEEGRDGEGGEEVGEEREPCKVEGEHVRWRN